MKSTHSHPDVRHAFAVVLALILPVCGTRPAAGQEVGPSTNIIPVIKMDEVPLLDAIRNLARQANINIIIDPHLLSSRSLSQSSVSTNFTNVTAEQALTAILKNDKLTMVPNLATTIARVVSIEHPAKPVPHSEVGKDTPVIPVIIMDDVFLFDAINNLARQAELRVVIDQKKLDIDTDNATRRITISVRWEKLSARQALAAILDNYELKMVQDPANSSIKIVPKSRGQ